MADGLTISGAGATRRIRIQNDAAAPNALYYTEQDYANAFPADFIDNLTNPPSYKAKCFVENGDGVGTAKTTWKGTRSTVHFDPGFTYQVNATGRVNRYTEWGTIIEGADGEPVGYDGLEVFFGAATTIGGNFRLGGCDLRNYQAAAAGTIFLLPTTAGIEVAEAIDTDCYSGGTQAFGNATQPMTRLRRLTAVGFGAGTSGRVVQFNCLDADTPTFHFPNGNAKIDTGGLVIIRNPRFIGGSVLSETRLTFGGMFLNPRWSRQAVKTLIPGSPLEEYVNVFGMIRRGGIGVEDTLVQIFDKNGRKIVDVRTNAYGQLPTFVMAPSIMVPTGGTPFEDAVAAIASEFDIGLGSNAPRYQGPYRLEVNGDGAIAGYPKVITYLEAPFQVFLGTEREYYPLGFTIDLPEPLPTSDVPYFREDDVAAMLLLEGQDVSVGGETVKGILRRETAEVLAGSFDTPILGTAVVVTVQTDALQYLEVGIQLSVDGSDWLVREIHQIGDGALTEILLAEDLT